MSSTTSTIKIPAGQFHSRLDMVTTGIVFLPLAIICGAATQQPTDMLEVRIHRLSPNPMQ